MGRDLQKATTKKLKCNSMSIVFHNSNSDNNKEFFLNMLFRLLLFEIKIKDPISLLNFIRSIYIFKIVNEFSLFSCQFPTYNFIFSQDF